MVRSMLKSKKMPKQFWAEAMQCAIYVQNRCPHVKLDDQTPQEAWSGQKPTVSHLKVFGSVAYAHIPDQRRTKLEDKSKSRDVRVNEVRECDWNNSIEVITEVGESSVAAATTTTTNIPAMSMPTSIPTNSETNDDEDEPRQPRMRNAENISFEEAMRDEKWQIAMDEEIQAIDRNNTWELIDLPKGSQPIGVKWVFKKKMNAQSEIERYKARLVVKGYKKKSSWCVFHAIWLRNLLSKMMLKQADATVIHVDNKSTIELAKNPVNHERSKHIDVRFLFIRDHVKERNVELVHVASQDQVADIFTKPLPKVLMDKCKKMIGMMDGRSI
ncbi:hypothetical protein GQ457_05G025610 [Hibiscus cannabinus]